MGISVMLRDQSSTGQPGGEVRIEDIPARTTLRDLIRTRVRDEVARHNAAPGLKFRGLVMPDGAEPGPDGYTLPSGRTVDWERQAALAVEAFTGNGFFVLVDDLQVSELDAELDLTPESDIRFVRLVQLVGG